MVEVFPRNMDSGVCMPDAAGRDVPHALAAWMQPFRAAFTVPTWRHVLVLVMGAILVPGRRTVASALRVMGLEQVAQFSNYHRVRVGVTRQRCWKYDWVLEFDIKGLFDPTFPPDEKI